MKLAILTDDRVGDSLCITEHGLSILIENKGDRVILDFGQSDRFIHNAQKLGINLDDIGTMVLSHGHYDHANGLAYIKGKKVICHPNCFLKRYCKVTGKNDGSATSLEELQKYNQVILSERPMEITSELFFLGQISRDNDFECKEFPTVLENGELDKLFDDSGIVVKTEDGIVVITGCAHSGICNTIEYAKRITGVNKVLAVVGGFHLRAVNEDLEKVIEYLENNSIEHLLMGHCTCDEVCEVMKERLGDKIDIQVLGVGNIYEI